MTKPTGSTSGVLPAHGRGSRHRLACFQALAVLAVIVLATTTSAVEVTLASPLTTRVDGWADRPGVGRVQVTIEVPPDAPPDLGVGIFLADPHGGWYQHPIAGSLTPGRHELDVRIDTLASEPAAGAWDPAEAQLCDRGGIFFWSSRPGGVVLRVDWGIISTERHDHDQAFLGDLQADPLVAATGDRWQMHLRPHPFPADPYDDASFSLTLVVTEPDGGERRLSGFFDQPMHHFDRGDSEAVLPEGASRFTVRFRPRSPGPHHLAVEARWADGSSQRSELGTLEVDGEPWDDIVRVDPADPRFFSVDGAFIWPSGPNLRSVWDVRCRERLGTELTVDRGTLSYEAYLRRAAAGGANACEIWLSSWNLALEWNPSWRGFHGIRAYNQMNAWRLDQILDLCESLGIRVNLVVHNHGQGSDRTDKEWDTSPWNRANGGPLASPAELFVDERALAGQERLRRYVAARYADSPAILGWKLWSEMNLTAGSREALLAWHERASTRWAVLDSYGHPVTSHWSGDFRTVDQALAGLPGMGYVCIDAYHPSGNEQGWSLSEVLTQGTTNTFRGLQRLGKPVVVTEYGGNWSAAPEPQMVAEFAAGPWLALTTGYAAGPMLWWFEWIDQGDRWSIYQPSRRFLADEDLRGSGARFVAPATSAGDALWSGCWSRPGRRLGYVMDARWGTQGGDGQPWQGVTLDQGDQVPAGPISLAWWDADTGTIIDQRTWDHPGGPLVLTAPAFRRHLAYKLWRRGDEAPLGKGGKPPTPAR